jgi:superfamily II DNA or RNA helicase
VSNGGAAIFIMEESVLLQLQGEIAALEILLADKKRLLAEAQNVRSKPAPDPVRPIDNHSPPETKIALFRSLFSGRDDIYAKRFESTKSGKSGYRPACRNEWVRGVCAKPKITCGSCTHRSFEPVTDAVIRNHLAGCIPPKNEWGQPVPFVMGVYPLLRNETCNFLAVDFDKNSWQEDVRAFMNTCRLEGVPSALERSRSGNGAHVWIFFDKPVLAAKARKLGSFLMTRTLDRRPEIGLDSFDRFFPNQDTLPKGGFGNLIALPLQKAAREKNHSVFLDDNLVPYADQWQFLNSIQRVDESRLDTLIQNAAQRNELLPVVYEPVDIEAGDKPWQKKPDILPEITEPLPKTVEVICADQLYISHTGLPPVLRNRILRLASFANPEFYMAQKMRLPTWNKPRILYCYAFFPEYIGLPTGCFDNLLHILDHYHINPEIQDKQNHGKTVDFTFTGELLDEQQEALQKLLAYPTGILSAATAFGKTVVALRVMAERKVNTLILVHRKQLADQWMDRISQFLGIPKKEIGCYCGSKKKRTGIIDVAVMQSVVKKDVVADWINEYGQIIVDECHHISASSFERIIRKCPAYYRLGLSATVVRKDGQHPIVLMNLGDVRYTARKNETGFSQKVFPRVTGFTVSMEQGETDTKALVIQDIFRNLWTNTERNELIIQDILGAYREGRECLVLSERLSHLDILKEAMREQVPRLFVLNGGMGKKQIAKITDAIHSIPPNENRIILATGKYLGEGFDLPCLDTLFLVFPFSWKGTLVQYTGRLNRAYFGKKEIRVYDYVDDKVPALARMYGRRLNGYKALGFSIDCP